MASGGEASKLTSAKEPNVQEAIKVLKDDPNFKVITKVEYDSLMARSKMASTPHLTSPIGRGKNFQFFSPGLSPNPGLNTSVIGQYNVPKLPIFSGAEEPNKGEVNYEVWNFEVKCLQKTGQVPEYILLQTIRNNCETRSSC